MTIWDNVRIGLDSQVRSTILGRTISHLVSTEVKKENGDRSFTYATAVNITVVAIEKNVDWNAEKFGSMRIDDGYLEAPSTVSIKENDKVIFNGKTFMVKKALTQYADGNTTTKLFTRCNLVLE